MRQAIVITKANEIEHEGLSGLIENYLETKNLIEQLQNKKKELEMEIDKRNIQVIGVEKLGIKLSITPSKYVDKIDYEKTLANESDKEQWKMVKPTRVWNDKAIQEHFGSNTIYTKEQTKPIIRVSPIKE